MMCNVLHQGAQGTRCIQSAQFSRIGVFKHFTETISEDQEFDGLYRIRKKNLRNEFQGQFAKKQKVTERQTGGQNRVWFKWTELYRCALNS